MDDKYNIKQLILFVIIILLVLGIFYGITILITNNKNKSNKTIEEETTKEEATINYDEILVQNIYNQANNEYYVLASFDDDKNLSDYNSSVSKYKEKEEGE